jgi:hypothetical protein
VASQTDGADWWSGTAARQKCPKISYYIFALKMETVTFAETLDNFQLSTWLIPESQSYTRIICLCLNTHCSPHKELCSASVRGFVFSEVGVAEADGETGYFISLYVHH